MRLLNKSMNIIFIITGLSTGGAQIMLLKLLRNLDKSKFMPRVISLTTKGDVGSIIESLGIPVHAIEMKPGTLNLAKFIFLVKLLRKYRTGVIHTWMYHADLLGGLAGWMAGIRRIAWGIRHCNLSPQCNKYSTLLVMRVCALLSRWLPQKILTCSEKSQSEHVAVGYCADKMTLIPNGFDLSHFLPNLSARDSVRNELLLPLDAPLVGLIARNDPQKNHIGFVIAAMRIHQFLPGVHFVLAGEGIDQRNFELMQAIRKFGLEDYFHLLGRREDVARLMAALDVLASSSDGEAFPNVLGEAMSCGIPCVVTDVGDSADIVGDSGRVVAIGDMTDLADNIVGILLLPASERQALGRIARERILTKYEIRNLTKRYQDIYVEMFI